MRTERDSPEKFLEKVNEEERQSRSGKLKIYFGAAPGVGKTYNMLQDALSQRQQGKDVVVGIAESHGRSEIDELLKNLEIIPKQSVMYRDKLLKEFDLDGVLKRKPSLVLMDEMAHTNIPGLRHEKRWQDIKEILDRGIDVYSTMNVQHVESINDDIAQIIGFRVRETVPDSMLEMADTIELVDLPAEDLLKRLHEGKVYFPEQAELAKENFFRKDKLTALRELALRLTAERVGAQAFLFRKNEGVTSIWPMSEKILVCVGADTTSLKLIRTAKRLASALHADWIALHIDKPTLGASNEDRKVAIQNLHLAEQLGAETRLLSAIDATKEIINFAREKNVTQIIVGKKIRSFIKNLFRKNLADEIVKHSGEIDVYVVTGSLEPTPIKTPQPKPAISWKAYAGAVTVVFIATLINLELSPFFSASNLIMIYLLGITFVALLGRMGPSIIASILSVLAYGYFFVAPYSFAISDIQYFFTLFVMLIVSQVISNLTILTKRQADSSYFTEHQTNILHTLSRQLSSTRGKDKILELSMKYLSDIFHCEVLALSREDIQLAVHPTPNKPILTPKEQSVAQWVFELGQKAGLGTDTLSYSNALYIPLLTSKGSVGVLRIKPSKSEMTFNPEQMRLLESCAHQIALALEADRIETKDRKTELQETIDRVRHQLLQDISHDIRTPLIAAMGGLTMLIENKDPLSSKKSHKIIQDTYFELEKLSRLINKLLQITYLENKSLDLKKESFSIKHLIDLTITSMQDDLKTHRVQINIPEEIPKIDVDPILLVDVFRNFLENAVKFTPHETTINISARQEKNKIIVCINDQGPGIVNDEKDKLFEKFYRGRKITTERGLGLGLAICHNIIVAHGGNIWAENLSNGGAAFCFQLPITEKNKT